MKVIQTYFPELNEQQCQQLAALYDLYTDWNAKINVISRKDIEKAFTHLIVDELSVEELIKKGLILLTKK